MRGPNAAWVSGSGGVVFRTDDGGRRWWRVSIPGAGDADFRDIELLPDGSILLMSVGEGSKSAVYRSTDEGKSWTVVLRNPHRRGFFDAMAFDRLRGFLYGDPVEGRFDLYRTVDGGRHWQRMPEPSRPPAQPGEVGFAASGTGMAVRGHRLWIGTGGNAARVHYSQDGGVTWSASDTGIRHGTPSSGIFSLDFADDSTGVAIGGDYLQPLEGDKDLAFSTDGGVSWQLPSVAMPHKACVRFLSDRTLLACGRTGVAISPDRGNHWRHVSAESYYTFCFDRASRVGYLAGANGRVAKLVVGELPQ